MPYTKAHYYLLGLIPLILIAFAPNYFLVIDKAPLAHHLHSVSSSMWLFLLITQSWLAANKNFSFHKKLGLLVFLVAPFMTGAFAMVTHQGAVKTAEGSAFYQEVGTALLVVDVALTFLTPFLVYQALKHRRTVELHSGYMFATMLGLLGPIIARVFVAFIPGFAITSVETLYRFNYSLMLSIAVTLLIAAWLYLRNRKYGRPWLLSGAVISLSYAGFITFGKSDSWTNMMLEFATFPSWISFAFGGGIGVVACICGWQSGKEKLSGN
ncbi:cytochrome d ubiquinol oxidase subunit II [Thalassotalea litorea]|uniref:Cytochrome d ubiquinol oxidase subunit II n=1 Tax=Thalassotalea litorea TaxID=2020715 RepID=A0A5R9IDZ1_9GAMM|nr:cytochrome d ubiquinol oxidase subunit II [Thalassotalea litorea]TLU61821.1 cytochrome d ubiquinol oxidase subunit II [Thalassotalea litorea]